MSNMANLPHFQKLQYTFTAHIRNPKHNPAPIDIEARRMLVYTDLFYNNVKSLLTGTYPVLSQVLPKEQWHDLVRDYFANHKATTPLFPKMPQEFLRYLESERGEQPNDPPFLYELAHYEWVELAVSIDTREIELKDIQRNGDLLNNYPVVNPLAWALAYQFPVHQISPDYQPQEPPTEATYIIVYRNFDDDVHFVHLNPISAHLFKQLQENTQKNGQQILEEMATTLQHPNPEVIIASGLQIMEEWRKRNIVLGVREDG